MFKHSNCFNYVSTLINKKGFQFPETLCGIGRGGRIRTYDLLLPKQTRYRATLHPVFVFSLLQLLVR